LLGIINTISLLTAAWHH